METCVLTMVKKMLLFLILCNEVMIFPWYSDHNREAVLSSGGCKLLFEQLSRCLDDSSEDGQSDRIKCITCGCILNLANDNGTIVNIPFKAQ